MARFLVLALLAAAAAVAAAGTPSASGIATFEAEEALIPTATPPSAGNKLLLFVCT